MVYLMFYVWTHGNRNTAGHSMSGSRCSYLGSPLILCLCPSISFSSKVSNFSFRNAYQATCEGVSWSVGTASSLSRSSQSRFRHSFSMECFLFVYSTVLDLTLVRKVSHHFCGSCIGNLSTFAMVCLTIAV